MAGVWPGGTGAGSGTETSCAGAAWVIECRWGKYGITMGKYGITMGKYGITMGKFMGKFMEQQWISWLIFNYTSFMMFSLFVFSWMDHRHS
jgi:hypothetical protein